jgi:hypothetical protein
MSSYLCNTTLVLIIGITFACERERFKYIGEDGDEGRWYIDTKSISYPKKNVVRVWVMIRPPRNSKNFQKIQDYLKEKGKDYENFAIAEVLYDIDCSENIMMVLKSNLCDKDHKILNSEDEKLKEWEYVSPETMGELIKESVCRKF